MQVWMGAGWGYHGYQGGGVSASPGHLPFTCCPRGGWELQQEVRKLYLTDLQGGDGTGPAGHQDHSVAMGQGSSQQGHEGKQGPLVRAHNGQHAQRLPQPEHRAFQLCHLQGHAGGQGLGTGASSSAPFLLSPPFLFCNNAYR